MAAQFDASSRSEQLGDSLVVAGDCLATLGGPRSVLEPGAADSSEIAAISGKRVRCLAAEEIVTQQAPA